MSKSEKLLERLMSKPKDLSWTELSNALNILGFEEMKNTKTGGSRRKFYNQEKNIMISLHKPHPKPILKSYAIEQIIDKLKEVGLI